MGLVNSLFLTTIALKILGAQATVNYICNDADLLDSLHSGVKEAIQMAQGGYETLSQPLNEQVVQGLTPVLANDDLADVATLFLRMTNIFTATEIYDIYCDTSFVTWNEGLGEWVDSTFNYPTPGPDGGVVRLPISVQTGDTDPKVTPGSQQLGWTLLGTVIEADPSTGRVRKDFSDQRHIYISPSVLNVNSNDGFDRRPVYTIASQGFSQGNDEGYIHIDSIDPPSITIFHELTHAVGGWDLLTGRDVVWDGAEDDYYGWEGVLKARKAGEPAVTVAETLTYVAKIIALSEVDGQPVWWGTGWINAENYLAILKQI